MADKLHVNLEELHLAARSVDQHAETSLTDGVLDRCATIESWYLPPSELEHDRTSSGIYRARPSPNADGGHQTNVVISISLPESSEG